MTSSGRIVCRTCSKPCYGQALRVEEHHFHPSCFVCHVCKEQLNTSGFFFHGDNFYCADDYQKEFGTQCPVCGKYVEGDVITALGKMYHQKCFVCGGCGKPFPPGQQVVAQGDKYFCELCLPMEPPQQPPSTVESPNRACAQCGDNVQPGQALLALDKFWHVHCFVCHDCCRSLTSQQFMSKNDAPYCLQDYYRQFGVKCANCDLFISGKVIQAGDNHYHAQCSKCKYCKQHFGEGIDIFVFGRETWHTDCNEKVHRSNMLQVSQQRKASIDVVLQANAALTASRKEACSPNHLVDGNFSKMADGRRSATPPVRQERGSGHSFGGDSAISCTTPSSMSPDNEASLSTNIPPVCEMSEQHQDDQQRHEDSSASSASTPSPLSEEGHMLSPIKSPLRSPRPKSIAYEPSHGSGTRLSHSSTFEWKSTSASDTAQDAAQPRPSSGRTLASGVLSSSLNKDRFMRAFSVEKTDQSNELPSVCQTVLPPPDNKAAPAEKNCFTSQQNNNEQRVIYSLEQLRVSSISLLPSGVDRTRLEDYLSEEDFKSVFSMDRSSYRQLQKWRQNDLKRKAKLF